MTRSTSSNAIEDKLYATTRMPAPRPEFLSGLRARLASEAQNTQDSLPVVSLRGKIRLTFRRPAWALVAAVFILILAVFAFAPVRGALANAWNHWFKPTSAEQFPTPSTAELASPTFAPTFAVTLIPAGEVEATPTPAPLPTDSSQSLKTACGDDPYGYSCRIARAEKQAGFDAKEFPADPKGFAFKEVAKASQGEIWLEYDVIGGGGYLYLSQGIGSEFPHFTGAAPESAIEEVQVGENRGEYVEGDWVIGGQYKQYTWLACCRARLRWVADGRWFELDKQSGIDSTNYMTRDVLIRMATQLVDHPNPATGPRADYLTSLAEASQLAEFAILAPTVLPQGFKFSYATYNQDLGQLWLIYNPGGDPSSGIASITIIETPLEKVSLDPGNNGQELQGEAVEINGHPGIYYVNANSPALSWQTDTLVITIWVESSQGYGGAFTKGQILEIGRSMK